MPIVVTKVDSPSARIKVRRVGESILPSTRQSVTLTTNATSALNRLDALLDVVEGVGAVNGAAPIYDEASDTYVVKQIDLDGGSF